MRNHVGSFLVVAGCQQMGRASMTVYFVPKIHRPSKPSDRRHRICHPCAATTIHLRLGAWASGMRCHRCRSCGHLVDLGELVQVSAVQRPGPAFSRT
jgi:hypothetical protein